LDLVASMVRGLAPGSLVVSGGARGVDRTAEEAALARGLPVTSYRPRKDAGFHVIDKHEFSSTGEEVVTQVESPYPLISFRDAAFFRNGLIVAESDRVAAFWTGSSNGTANAINHALRQQKPYRVVDQSGCVVDGDDFSDIPGAGNTEEV
jgi:predicted Rossmann fold nucleotide-binding protein DprA/Smf involved in DNA uptake